MHKKRSRVGNPVCSSTRCILFFFHRLLHYWRKRRTFCRGSGDVFLFAFLGRWRFLEVPHELKRIIKLPLPFPPVVVVVVVALFLLFALALSVARIAARITPKRRPRLSFVILVRGLRALHDSNGQLFLFFFLLSAVVVVVVVVVAFVAEDFLQSRHGRSHNVFPGERSRLFFFFFFFFRRRRPRRPMVVVRRRSPQRFHAVS